LLSVLGKASTEAVSYPIPKKLLVSMQTIISQPFYYPMESRYQR